MKSLTPWWEPRSRAGVRAAAPLLFFTLLGLGCGADTPAAYRDYARETAQLSCERAFRCCGRRCPTSADATFNNSIKNVEFALNQGLATYNATQAKACLDASAALYTNCAQYVATIDTGPAARACTGIIQGALPIGAACSQTTDYCVPNTYCAIDSSLKPPQARCRRTLNVGDACDGTVRCMPGSSCDTGGTGVCKTNQTGGALNDSCSGAAPCGGGLTCLPSGVCGVPQEGGQACVTDTQCLSGRCAIDTCTVPMTRPTTVSEFICGSVVIP